MPHAIRVPAGALADQLPGVSVSFRSKPPHTRFDIVVSSPMDQPLRDDLANALLAIGFNRRRKLSDEHGISSQSFEREGSGLCGGWSAAERDKLTRDARFALRGFGFTMVPEVRA